MTSSPAVNVKSVDACTNVACGQNGSMGGSTGGQGGKIGAMPVPLPTSPCILNRPRIVEEVREGKERWRGREERSYDKYDKLSVLF